MALHRDLTGADLHEPKGISTAGDGQSYVANGSGSGTWRKLLKTDIDTSNIKALTEFGERLSVQNINEAKINYYVIGRAGLLFEVRSIVSGLVNTDTTITIRKNSTSAFSSFVVPASIAPGTTFSGQPVPPVSFALGDILTIETNGSGSGLAPLNFHFLYAY